MSPAEMVTIAVVALLVFGPQRLPEIARKIGKVGREISRAANELKTGIEREFDEASEPLKDVRRRLGATIVEADGPEPHKPISSGGPKSDEPEQDKPISGAGPPREPE